MSSTGEAPFCWGPEVAGGRGGALEGGEGEPQDFLGAAMGEFLAALRAKSWEEIRFPHLFIHPANINEDLLAV